MSTLTSPGVVMKSGNRNPGASRPAQPEVPVKRSIKLSTAPVTPPPAANPKPVLPAVPAKSSAAWVYRGVVVDPAAVRADLMLAHAARAKSSEAVVYRGSPIDPAFAREQALLEQAARARSTATIVYRGVPVQRS